MERDKPTRLVDVNCERGGGSLVSDGYVYTPEGVFFACVIFLPSVENRTNGGLSWFKAHILQGLTNPLGLFHEDEDLITGE